MAARLVSFGSRTAGLPAPIVVQGLSKAYGQVPALADVSLTIRPGEILGLVGPKGAGKTTLFECLAGLLPYDAGTISLGREAWSAHDRAADLFYLTDGIAPWPDQTVEWALRFTVGFFGGPDRFDDVTERLDLGRLLGLQIGRLSRGECKRVILAVGLLTPHPVLLSDEPFDGLDPRQTRDVAAALREQASGGRTLLLSMQRINDAARICDRLVVLIGGIVRAQGTFQELASQPGAATAEDAVLALG